MPLFGCFRERRVQTRDWAYSAAFDSCLDVARLCARLALDRPNLLSRNIDAARPTSMATACRLSMPVPGHKRSLVENIFKQSITSNWPTQSSCRGHVGHRRGLSPSPARPLGREPNCLGHDERLSEGPSLREHQRPAYLVRLWLHRAPCRSRVARFQRTTGRTGRRLDARPTALHLTDRVRALVDRALYLLIR